MPIGRVVQGPQLATHGEPAKTQPTKTAGVYEVHFTVTRNNHHAIVRAGGQTLRRVGPRQLELPLSSMLEVVDDKQSPRPKCCEPGAVPRKLRDLPARMWEIIG